MSSQKHLFFLGIGGIGMSALARYFHQSGYNVSGYDREKTALTEKLEALGIKIQYQFDGGLLDEEIDRVVYTPAIKEDRQEFQYFKTRDIEMKKRSEMLKEVLSKKKVIAVAGTHGKTTTSALLAHLLSYNSFGATAFVGGVMSNYGTNFLYGEGPWVIVEADEYDRSFWRLYPEVAVIQAMDADHLDIYGTEESMIDAYRIFTSQIVQGGKLFVATGVWDNMSDTWREELRSRDIEIETFGLSRGDTSLSQLSESEGTSRFYFEKKDVPYVLDLAGQHNVQNALGAISVARTLGIEEIRISEALKQFKGIERRFEYILRSDRTIIIDDYAHHPKEIDAAILAVRKNHPGRRLTVVFQPHLYTRTRDFMKEFAVALSNADEVVLVELYPARELPIDGVNSERLLSMIQIEQKEFILKKDLVQYLGATEREVILNLGAGDVYKLMNDLKRAYSK